jgi:putative membrane protein
MILNLQLQDAITSIADERTNQISQDRERTNNLTVETKELYGGLSENVTKLIEDIKVASLKTEENISSIQKSSLSAITGMNNGALVMKEAAEKFSLAGNSVSGVLDKSKSLNDQITQTATTLQLTSNTVRQAFEQYDQARKSTQDYVLSLQELVENAKKESGIGSRMISDLERILGSLQTAEKQSVEYLEKVNNVLRESFETFGREMTSQVRNVSGENDKLLSQSLGALQAAVESMIASVARSRRVA